MKSYTELTESQKLAAINYHLNRLIPPFADLAQSPPGAPWSSIDSVVAALTPQAFINAQASFYHYDTKRSILMLVPKTFSPSALDKYKSCAIVGM